MIKCYRRACKSPAVKTIVVRRRGYADRTWLVCLDDHESAWRMALKLSQESGGSLHTAIIDIPKRRTASQPTVHVHTHIDEDLHRKLIFASQSLRVSQRQFIGDAIRAYITVRELREGES